MQGTMYCLLLFVKRFLMFKMPLNQRGEGGVKISEANLAETTPPTKNACVQNWSFFEI